MSAEPAHRRRKFALGEMLYRFAVVFPSWAGAFLLLYVLLNYGLSTLSVYFR